MKSVCAGVLGAVVVVAACEASVSFDVAGLGGTGVTADVELSYQSISDRAARLTIEVTNTSSQGVGGFITGLAFNVPTVQGVSIMRVGGDRDDRGAQRLTQLGGANERRWFARFDNDGILAPNQTGAFDVGITNRNSMVGYLARGSGSPNASRITRGETTTFTLQLSGRGLDNLTDEQFERAFLNELSFGDGGAYNFGIRFQGVGRGIGSPMGRASERVDMAVASAEVVPLPSGALLAGAGICCGGLMRRLANRRSKCPACEG